MVMDELNHRLRWPTFCNKTLELTSWKDKLWSVRSTKAVLRRRYSIYMQMVGGGATKAGEGMGCDRANSTLMYRIRTCPVDTVCGLT